MAIVQKKQNNTMNIKIQENSNINTNVETNYLNEALCKMSKSIFFNHQISYCSNGDVDKTSKKKYDIFYMLKIKIAFNSFNNIF